MFLEQKPTLFHFSIEKNNNPPTILVFIKEKIMKIMCQCAVTECVIG